MFEKMYNNYGKPTTYTRISTKRGSGFILKRISEASSNGGLTRKEVYPRDGYNSMIWSALIEDGLIVPVNGRRIKTHDRTFNRLLTTFRVASYTREAPRYVITKLGQKILDKAIIREKFEETFA